MIPVLMFEIQTHDICLFKSLPAEAIRFILAIFYSTAEWISPPLMDIHADWDVWVGASIVRRPPDCNHFLKMHVALPLLSYLKLFLSSDLGDKYNLRVVMVI